MGAIGHAIRLLGGGHRPEDMKVRNAAWIARCVGRGDSAPLLPGDLTALANTLRTQSVSAGTVVFDADKPSGGVWIVRHGQIELSVGAGRHRAVIHVLRPGDVDGDLPLLLDMQMPYTARALTDSVCLFLDRAAFESLLATHPAIARRWLSSVAQRLAASQARILGLLGRTLTAQVAQLLLDEAGDGSVELAQRTLAAMLGVQRPSLNKILKDFERAGLVTIRYGAVDVLDPTGLARRAS